MVGKDIVQKALFELIQIGLNQSASFSVHPSDKEWSAIFQLAQKQSMEGICYAGLQALEGKCRPLLDLLYHWIGIGCQIEERNRTLNSQCKSVQKRLLKDGMRGCILKGQGNALMYGRIEPKLALLRQPGDIDVWLAGGFEKVVKYAIGIKSTEEIDNHHIDLALMEDVEVEAHYTPSRLINKMTDRRLQRWYREETERQMSHYVTMDDVEISVPTDDFNHVYQMTHICHHFFTEGIGLRQLTDYYVLLSTSELSEEEKDKVRRLVKDFGMEKFARAIMWVMGYVFQLEQSKMLWYPDGRRGKFLLSEVMKMGNFGHTDGRFVLRREDSHVRRFWQRVKGKMRFFKYFPSEALWYPVSLLWLVVELRWLRWKVRRYEKECVA